MTRDRGSGRAVDLDPTGVYTLNPECVAGTFDGRVVLYHLNQGRALTLNRTAAIVLELMDGERSTAEILEVLRQAYPESADDIARDVDRTLRYLLEHDALETER